MNSFNQGSSNIGGLTGSIDRLRGDIHINRSDLLDKDKRIADQEDQLVQSKKEVISLCLYSKLYLNSNQNLVQ